MFFFFFARLALRVVRPCWGWGAKKRPSPKLCPPHCWHPSPPRAHLHSGSCCCCSGRWAGWDGMGWGCGGQPPFGESISERFQESYSFGVGGGGSELQDILGPYAHPFSLPFNAHTLTNTRMHTRPTSSLAGTTRLRPVVLISRSLFSFLARVPQAPHSAAALLCLALPCSRPSPPSRRGRVGMPSVHAF